MIRYNQPRTQVRNVVVVAAVAAWIALSLLSSSCEAASHHKLTSVASSSSSQHRQRLSALSNHKKKLLIQSQSQHHHHHRIHYDHQQRQSNQQQIESTAVIMTDESSGYGDDHEMVDADIHNNNNNIDHDQIAVPLTAALSADHHHATAAATTKSFSSSVLQLIGGSSSSNTVSSNVVVATGGVLQRLKVGAIFLIWYALNIVYNILNKKVLNVLPAPLVVGTLQLGVGALYVSLLWSFKLRTRPHVTSTGRRAIQQIGIWHSLGQLATVVSLGAGAVSFTHIVKAMEPFFSALVSALISHKWMPWYVYATLIPVVSGVGYASYKETNFSVLAFCTAMGSNLAFALRAVLSKGAMTPKKGESIGTGLTPANVFGLVTLSAFWMSVPLAMLGEGSSFVNLWKTAVTNSNVSGGKFEGYLSAASFALWRNIFMSGFFHYMNNEVMYMALDNVHPVTLAVGNTMKRVFILVASVMFFQNSISFQSGIGAAVGIAGVLLYSLTLDHYTATQKALSLQHHGAGVVKV